MHCWKITKYLVHWLLLFHLLIFRQEVILFQSYFMQWLALKFSANYQSITYNYINHINFNILLIDLFTREACKITYFKTLVLCNNHKTEILLHLDSHVDMIPTRGNPYSTGKSYLSAPIRLKQDRCKPPMSRVCDKIWHLREFMAKT